MSTPRGDRGVEHAAHRTRNDFRASQQRSGMGRALGLTTLSALLPGLGLLGTRRRGVGIVVVTLAVLGLGAAGVYAVSNGLTTTALETAGSTRTLQVIAGVLVAGTVVWIAAIALTALQARPRRTTGVQKLGLGIFTTLLCLAVSAPAALGVRYISAHVDAVGKVFSSESVGASGATPTSAIRQDTENPWEDLPRVNLLLLGSDAAEAREGTRTDTMIVLSVDTTTGDSVMFSVPRNLMRVPFPREHPLHEVYPAGYDCGDQCLMNAVWTEAEKHAEEFPQLYAGDALPGLTATREVLETVLGLELHHTVIVNLQGFEDLIDAMGGVVVNIQEPIPVGGRTYTDAAGKLQLDPTSDVTWLQPGSQRLDGATALGYSRSRVTTDDFSRMRRQRCMVAAVIDQAEPMTLLQRYPQIIGAVGDNVATDIPAQDLDEWATLTLRVQAGTMRSLPFTSSNTDTVDPNFSEIRARVYDALHATPVPPPPSTPDDAATTSSPEAPAPTDDAAVTTSPTDDAAISTGPVVDELEDVGAVCD
ncbi:LCP family protein [Ornithinimicrobium flavum]|uniref:LCP family protein n=1 Tax=Ornithinimicrobium flavum TaxID=1288636 RepID=UPI00106F5A1E|nr:LCP family protein [Ornithinimicrobium flavum]